MSLTTHSKKSEKTEDVRFSKATASGLVESFLSGRFIFTKFFFVLIVDRLTKILRSFYIDLFGAIK